MDFETIARSHKSHSELMRKTYLQTGRTRRSFLMGSVGVGLFSSLVAPLIGVSDAIAQGTKGLAIRKSANNLQDSDPEVKLLKDAVGILKGRGDAPNGWNAMSFYHRDFCGVAPQKEIHFSWFFLPWHRAYLTVVERHLQDAVGEPTLGLPYWDWYANRSIPGIYLGDGNPLNDVTRNPSGPQMEDDDFGNSVTEGSLTSIGSFSKFGGNDPTQGRGGDLEAGPHGGGHVFVGGNMGRFPTAGLDPLFYAHHGNIDRLWEVWRNSSANHKEPGPESGWDERELSFLDADGSMIDWLPSETIDTEALGFQYDDVSPKEVLVASGTGGISSALSSNVNATISLADTDGNAENYELGAGGLLLSPQIPPSSDGLSAPLSSVSTGELVGSRRVYLDVFGFKIPPETGYLHVHLNFENDIGEIDRSISRSLTSYAGGQPFVPLGDGEHGTPAINLSIDITERTRAVNILLSEISVLIVPFDRSGVKLSEGTTVGSLSLRIE